MEAGDHGVYTVSSAYKTLREVKEISLANSEGECSDKREVRQFWRAVWRMRNQNKVKLFTWRLYQNALPTARSLRKRGIEVDLNCKICGYKEESAEHIFITCWWAKAFWEQMGLAHYWDAYNFENIQEWLWCCFKSLSLECFALSCFGAYMIWRNRNLVTNNQKGQDIFQCVAFAKSRINLFNRPQFKFSVLGHEEALSWKAPVCKALKVNCDGSLNVMMRRVGWGCVVRDSLGVVVGAVAGFEDNILSSIDAEGLAILMAINWASREAKKECVFETDCAEIFSMILSFSGGQSSLRPWLSACALALAKEEGWSLSLVRREANTAADRLARKAVVDGWSWNNQFAIPRCLGDYL